MEIATVSYIQRQSITFFNSILESSAEFRKAFNGSGGGISKYSSFLIWVEEELDKFCSERVEKQIFSPSTPLETIATCIELVRGQASKLKDKGLDVVYIFDAKFRRNVERCVSCFFCIQLLAKVLNMEGYEEVIHAHHGNR